MHRSIPLGLAAVLLTSAIPTDRTFAAGKLIIEPPSVITTPPVFVGGFLVPNQIILTNTVYGQSNDDREMAIVAAQNVVRPKVVVKQYSLSSIQQYAQQKVTEEWGSDQEWQAFSWIVNEESGWNPLARNGEEGACGLPQALPCSKLPDGINTPPDQQIDWMINYIKNRYGDPVAAKQAHLVQGWY